MKRREERRERERGNILSTSYYVYLLCLALIRNGVSALSPRTGYKVCVVELP